MNRDKILEILGKITQHPKEELLALPKDALLTDIGLSSLSFIQFIVAVEEEFHIEILDSDLLVSYETLDMLFSALEKYFHTVSAIKKVLICDCDNCLWHGISGEEFLYTDAAADAFHNTLLQLYQNGILLCLCSKNEPRNIQNAFEQLDTPLKPEHFLIAKINRHNKADNILEISKELHLSLDSFVFLDDSDYELGLINILLPEVVTIKADYEKNTFVDEILSCFCDITTDFDRTRQYREQKERERDKLKITNVDAYNASLETIVTCQTATSAQAQRIAELSQRTNQCNLSCARYSSEDIVHLLSEDDYVLLSLSVTDKYGDMGIVGAAVIRKSPHPVVESFFLSCRAFDRHFEEILLSKAKALFPHELAGIFKDSGKNTRYRNFYPDHGVPLYE